MDLLKIQRDLNAYLRAVRVETDAEPQPFAKVCDPFQREDIDAIAPALRRLVNPKAPQPKVQRAWWVRGRGHSKTADVAMLVAWVLAFSRRRRRMVWVAADKDQGCEGLDSIATLTRHNPWLGSLLEVQRDKIINRNTQSTIYFTTSDVCTAFGWKDVDLFVMDEVTHWPLKGEDLWTAMYSAAGKRKSAVVFALMNAGFFDTFQRRLRDTAAQDPNWHFSELSDSIASWISKEQLADQAKYLPRISFDRLWRNRWTSGLGDALTEADINAAFLQELQPIPGPIADHGFVAGVDLGIKRHASAVVTLCFPKGRWGKVRLADHKVWLPTPGHKVDLREVGKYLLDLDRRFNLETVSFDPWQAELLATLLEAHSQHRRRSERKRLWAAPFMSEVTASGSNLRDQASLTIEYFTDHKLQFYDCPPLRHDLLHLRCEEKTYGVRLVSPEDATGHGDTFSAFANALLVGHRFASKKPVRAGINLSDHRTDSLVSPHLQRAAAEFDRHAAEFQLEQGFGPGEADNAPFQEAMFYASEGRRCGLPPGYRPKKYPFGF